MSDGIPAAPVKNPKALLAQYGLRAKKSFGQNFLADTHLLSKLSALLPEGASVIEIGAGLGGLTQALLHRGHRVTAIERDRDLVPVLSKELAREIATGQLTLVEADAKTFDYRGAFASGSPPRALVGNLPYQLTGPLLRVACSLALEVERVVFLVQEEVAERLCAGAGSAAYGAASVFTQAAFTVERAFIVRRGAFYPQPNVDSAVVTFTPREVPTAETDAFRALVQAAFSQRRKTLRNAWTNVFQTAGLEIQQIAGSAGVDLRARGEDLDVAAFERISRAFEDASRTRGLA